MKKDLDNILNMEAIELPDNLSGVKYEEHAVIIYFDYGLEETDEFYNLGNELDKILREKKVGEYDGHEMAMDNSDGSFYMYGANAEILFKTVRPILEKRNFMSGATALLRFGPTGEDSPEIEITI